ncbi:AAA family ATPase [Prevotella intermedia]|uniref:Endonuclease GajA/Old nuclease/RecF-like AAA domain-containing protein n=1 Tax=Prevotella intermedia TaxID=28131 RepID=A0A424ZA10_PREIN|nr:AAA family ATPase [Prevotella intermedia]RQE06178.1 hypothetical protein D2S53_03000 [Prevotella intermedia]RRF88132.1 hypothetical protein D2S45_02080 [Prevotella intermedia]
MDNFKIQSIYIGEKCDEKYCKVLKRGCEYKFYSGNLTEEINLYGDNINICALVGKNGSGKSSLLDILYRLANNFGYLLFRGVVMPGAETPKYLKQIYASIKFKLNETYLELKCEDTKMYLKENSDIVWYDEYSGGPINNNAEGKLKGDFDAFTSSDKDNKIIKTASKFFYTIVTNYSIQSFNYDDYEDEGEWLHNVFHKNDGYSHPIVLNPFRTTSGIDIENEGELTNYRLSAILLKDQEIIKENKEKKSFIDGYHLKRLEYHYSPFKYYSNIFDSLKDGDSEKEKHKEDDASSLIKFINGKFLEAFKIKGSCTNLILNKFISNLQLSDESPLSFKTACVYLVYKVLSSTKYPGYAKYFSHYHKYEKCLDANPVNSDFENFLEEIKSDQSHIANKLNQTIQFINEYKELEERIGIPPLNDENSMFNFLSYIGERKLPNNITDIMRELPPPFFKVKILLCKKSQQNKEEEISFNKLSSGEKQFAYMMSTYIYHLANLESITPKVTDTSLHSKTGRVGYRMINLVFDEMELCFHPEYQRTFVNNLISYIKRMELNKTFSFNIILTTHSPFILSDIPACNILALKDGEPDEQFKNEKTLAANIYDILNNGFFMNDFIGEYSSIFIDEIIKKLNDSNDDISAKEQEILFKQISLIGDDFVRIKLLEKLDQCTNNRFSIEERKRILSKELEKLN